MTEIEDYKKINFSDNKIKEKLKISPVCRICGSEDMVDILSFGDQPLANSLKDNQSDHEIRFPLTLSYCPKSSLVQIRETVDKEILFSQYVWVSGTALTTRDFAKKFSQKIIDSVSLKNDELLVEIASNDGTFLKPFIKAGFKNVLGVDPAKNIAKIANQEGVRTIPEFWNNDVAKKIDIKYGKAKVIIARNVIPHVSDLHDVIAGISHLLRDDGIGIIEFHYAGNILEGLQYDSIYHEHLCYFSVKSITNLLKLFDLVPFNVDLSPISGGAIVVYFSKGNRKQTEKLVQVVQQEESKKINTLAKWKEFAEKSIEHKKKSLDIVSSFSNKIVLGFGASARSSTYLNYCGFTQKQIKAIIDNNKFKQGKFTPGAGIPIISFDEGLKVNPDLIFILAWNFKGEIIQRCKSGGYSGEFLVSFPDEPKILRS